MSIDLKNLDLKTLKGSLGGKQKDGKKKVKRLDFYAEVKGKKCFSFDFGTYATKLTVAKVTAGNVQVIKQIQIENREINRSIEADNINEWRTKISKALDEHKLNPSGQIGICAVDSSRYIARQFELPLVDESDLHGLAAYELGQSLELDMDEHVFQHKVLRTYEKNNQTMCTVWAAAIPKSLCQNYYDLLTSLKLRPLCLDVHVSGLENILTFDQALAAKSQDSSVAMIDYGLRNTEMYIISKGNCIQTTNIDSGEGKLISAAKNALGAHIVDLHNSNKLTVPPQQIYEIIRDAKTSETAAVFADVVQKWIAEINNVIRRFNIDHPGTQIERVFVYGGSQQLPWLKAYLEKLIGIPVEIIDGSDCFSYSDAAEDFAKYINSASVLLRRNDENDCNFFDGFVANRTGPSKIPASRIVLLFVALILVCGLIYGYQAFRTHMLKKQLDYLQSLRTSEALNKNYIATLELGKILDAMEEEETFMTLLIENTKLSNTANLDLMRVIDRCIGEDGTIQEITVDSDTIKLTIERDSTEAREDMQKLTAIEQRFRQTGYFSNVLVTEINEDAEGQPITLDCTLVLKGGAIHEE